MSIYLVKSFSIDKTVEKNPPLSKKGIREAKELASVMPLIRFDFCFTSPLICDYASAMLLVGDKVIIDRDLRLQKKSTVLVEKQLDDFVLLVEKEYQNKNILIVSDTFIVTKLNKKLKESILLN